ncbi:hypothetical protein JOS77_28960 [Chromobacterium haemolyticum]|nr:hypothetical protein JOS77_28960 [Chromobacterium haemolyticum]
MTIQSREQDLLGWMMARGELPEHVASLKPEWFSDRLNGYIFSIVCQLSVRGELYRPINRCGHAECCSPGKRA